jgi:hypothetical protein
MKRSLLVAAIAAALVSTALLGAPVAGANGPSISIGPQGGCGAPTFTQSYPYQYLGSYCRHVTWGNYWYVRGWYVWNWSGQYVGWWECRSTQFTRDECYWGRWNPY